MIGSSPAELGAARYERVGAVAVIAIRRPQRRNAIDGPTAEAMVQAVRAFNDDPDARVLVVTGDEEAFCAGADLTSLQSLRPRAGKPEGVFGARRFSPKPAIAAISGWCLGGGVTLATWCDLRIAADTARFGFPDRQWGVPILDGGADRLAAIIGLGRALDLVLTGREVSAATALAMGLVTEVVPPGELVTRALEIAERIASFPQATLLADRWGLLEELDQRMEFTAQRDVRTLKEVGGDAEQASARFTSGGREG
jgi:enoyl-CoA hydratase/carnithine racemase